MGGRVRRGKCNSRFFLHASSKHTRNFQKLKLGHIVLFYRLLFFKHCVLESFPHGHMDLPIPTTESSVCTDHGIWPNPYQLAFRWFWSSVLQITLLWTFFGICFCSLNMNFWRIKSKNSGLLGQKRCVFEIIYIVNLLPKMRISTNNPVKSIWERVSPDPHH